MEGIGTRHRIHCVENDGSYETVEKDDKRKKMPDSLVYRYHRRVGFQTTESSPHNDFFVNAKATLYRSAKTQRHTTASCARTAPRRA